MHDTEVFWLIVGTLIIVSIGAFLFWYVEPPQ